MKQGHNPLDRTRGGSCRARLKALYARRSWLIAVSCKKTSDLCLQQIGPGAVGDVQELADLVETRRGRPPWTRPEEPIDPVRMSFSPIARESLDVPTSRAIR